MVVRNIKSEGILHDGKTLWISDVGIVDVSALSDPSAQTASEIIYFSHHPETSDPEELSEIYYHFQLEQGKELRCQVGFLIDREVFEKGSYELTIGRGMATMIEGGTKYVKFEASLEDSR